VCVCFREEDDESKSRRPTKIIFILAAIRVTLILVEISKTSKISSVLQSPNFT
jgi:hypothetical protein